VRTNRVDNTTFTQLKRRDQLVGCAIDATFELGFQRASVAEVARRAGVSKGVVTYHFPAKDDLVRAVIADVLDSMIEYLEPRLLAAEPGAFPERYLGAYVTAWAGYLRTHSRTVIALVRIYNNFRDESGEPDVTLRALLDARAADVATLTQVLQLGQAGGTLGAFSAPVVAATVKAVMDDLMLQFAADPELDLEGYGAELVALFDRATGAHPGSGSPKKATADPFPRQADLEEK
jgi:TetR/AcrR family transcriptional regulator, fatty acid metabolism regulator protein